MRKIRGIVTKSWLILSLMSPAVVGVTQVGAEEQGLEDEVLLKDNTFILGRVKITQGEQVEVRGSLSDKGFGSIVSQENKDVVEESFEGYLEVVNRYKVGEEVWLAVEEGGQPKGYIKQGRLEVKPSTKVEKLELPEDVDLDGEFTKDGFIQEDLRFNGGKGIEVRKGDSYTIIDLSQVNFYTKDVESFKVNLGEDLQGWVKGSDLVGDKERLRVSGEEVEDQIVEVRSGTIIYDRPTYLEGTKGLGIVEEAIEGRLEKHTQNKGVREYYFKVYTKNGGLGYLKVNEENQEINKEIKEKVEVDSEEEVVVHVKDTSIITTKPEGVEGVSDQILVETEEALRVLGEVIVGNKEDLDGEYLDEEELDEEELDEEELDEEELDEEELEEEYYLVESEEGYEGYILKNKVVFDSDKEEYLKDKEKSLKERDNSKVREKMEKKEELVKASIKEKELEIENELGMTLEELEGWTVGQATGRAQVFSVGSGAVITSGSTVDFINQLAPYSQRVKDKGLYPSVMMAQAILESGGGSSELARNSNNLFGIKGSYQGRSRSYQTREYGGEVVINSRFREYPSIEHSIMDYVNLLNNSNYTRNGVVNASSPYTSIVGLKRAGYATDPMYVSKVWNTIEQYDLTRFD